MMRQRVWELLCEAVGRDQVLAGEPMKNHTTFRIGGPADYFVRPRTPGEVQAAVRVLKETDTPYFVLGNGSNLLVGDGGYRGAVIQLFKNFGEIRTEGTRITAQAGALLARVSREAQKNGLSGLEFASGIPGTAGGAVFMNAGAYGGEMAQVLISATVLTEELEIRTVSAAELELGYRHSSVEENGWLILSAELALAPGDPEQILARMEELKSQRVAKQPLEYPSAGSTFKRPEGYFAGKLIMDAGLRGFSVGGAQVSEKHCGFVVNTGDATAADVRTLMDEVSERVYEKFGVRLEPEVRMLGEFL